MSNVFDNVMRPIKDKTQTVLYSGQEPTPYIRISRACAAQEFPALGVELRLYLILASPESTFR